jgi:hypothetical protein
MQRTLTEERQVNTIWQALEYKTWQNYLGRSNDGWKTIRTARSGPLIRILGCSRLSAVHSVS